MGIGPKQYVSLDGFLTEQFVEGELFSRLRGDRTSSDNIYNIGRRMGEILSRLHSRDIYYNDTILTDDLGRSHVIVPEASPAFLFDYGVALRLNGHPNFTDEEVSMIKSFSKILPEEKSLQMLKSLIDAQYQMRYSPLPIVALEVALIENLKE